MDAKVIGNRIQLLLKGNKITAKELAKNTGIKESALTGYKKGEYAPSAEAIINISEFFNITSDWLLTGKGEMHRNNMSAYGLAPKESELLESYRKLDNLNKAVILERVKTILDMQPKANPPLLSKSMRHKIQLTKPLKPFIEKIIYDQRASAGFGNYFEQTTHELLSFNRDEVPDKADFGIRIRGDSMEPEIFEDDIVWVKAQPQIENGQVGIFILEDEAYCKKLHIDHEQRIISLVSLNSKYPPKIIGKSDNLITIGKVL